MPLTNEEKTLYEDWKARAKDCQSIEDLMAFAEVLRGHPLDYNSACWAIGCFAVAAANAASRDERIGNRGLTGFMASAVAWEFIEGWGALGTPGAPKRLIDYSDMLYPQYEESYRTITPTTWEWMQAEAHKKLAGRHGDVHDRVAAHWQSIVDGRVPFGYRVEER